MTIIYLKRILKNQLLIMQALRLMLIHQGAPSGATVLSDLENGYIKTELELEK